MATNTGRRQCLSAFYPPSPSIGGNPLADIFTLAADFRAKLLAGDIATLNLIHAAYEPILERFRAELDAVLKDFDANNRSKSFRLQRLMALAEGLDAEVKRFAVSAEGVITLKQRVNVNLAIQAMHALTVAGLGEPPAGVHIEALLASYPSEAVLSSIGLASDGSPLSKLLSTLAPDTVEGAKHAITYGIAAGESSDVIAGYLRLAANIGRVRALRIARTETMRAYNESSRSYLVENQQYVDGWYWHAAMSIRTCAMCWAMDGTWHPLDEPLASHVCCRCSMVPAVKSWSDLGYPDNNNPAPKPRLGVNEFERLAKAEQVQILGPGKWQAWKDGRFTLPDLVGERRSEEWGPARYERSLHDVLEDPAGGKGADLRVPLAR